MGHAINLSPANLQHEREIGQAHLARFGDLPTGNEVGGPFWDWVRHRFDVAVDTGHLARFEHYHPFITPWLVQDHQHRHPVVMVPHPPVTQVPPVIPPQLPPVIHVPPTPPYCPPPSVPEPSSLISLGIGTVIVLIFSRKFLRLPLTRR